MKILSIDGGGVRGIIAINILAELEKETGKKCNELFDIFSGTSTGSIIACALANGLSAQEVANCYMKMAKNIFPSFSSRMPNRLKRTFYQGFSAPKYDVEIFKQVLQNIFGEKTIGELESSIVVPTYNIFAEEDFIIKNSKLSHRDYKIWEVCLASCAAPGYFPSYTLDRNHVLIDGGFTANNPILCGIAEAINHSKKNLKDLIVVSVGTGIYKNVHSTLYKKSENMGFLKWIFNIIDVILDGNFESTKYIAKTILDKDKYFRLQVTIPKTLSKIDKTKNMKKLEKRVKKYMKTKMFISTIDSLKKIL